MATVLEDSQITEARKSSDILRNRLEIEIERPVSSLINELVIPIVVGNTEVKDLRYPITIAKRFRAGVVLVYVTQRKEIPPEFEEYARMERLDDYASIYYDFLGEQNTAALKKDIEAMGARCRAFTYIGSVKEAIQAFEHRSDVLVVLPAYSNGGKKIYPIGKLELSSLRVPVLVVPPHN